MDVFERMGWRTYFKNVNMARRDQKMIKWAVYELRFLAGQHRGKLHDVCLSTADTLEIELWGEMDRLDSDIPQWWPPYRELKGRYASELDNDTDQPIQPGGAA